MTNWVKQGYSEQELLRIMNKLLEEVEVFSGLTPFELGQLLENAEKFSFGPGQVILNQGTDGNYLYIIVSGEVRVLLPNMNGPAVEVARLAACDCFGEMTLTDHAGRSADVIASDQCLLLRVHENECWRYPIVSAKIFRNIARIVSERLRKMNQMALWRSKP